MKLKKQEGEKNWDKDRERGYSYSTFDLAVTVR